MRPYMWVYEGVADYFCRRLASMKVTEREIRQWQQYSLSTTFPDYFANYWAGESVYRFMEDVYGKEKVKSFIKNTYSDTVENALLQASGKNLHQIESEWKQWLEKE